MLRVDGRRGRKKIGPLDDAFQLFAWKGRGESSGAIEISGLKRCYFFCMMCGRSFCAAEGKEPVEGRGVMDGARCWNC